MIDFGSELRQRAITDGLMRVIRIDHYVVTVLVPELAVTPVKEDMKVRDESARQILQEDERQMLREDM
jgi:RTC4-like domain